MNAFILDETINSRTTWGLRITAPPVLPPTKRIVESITVDGREGTLTILKGWENIAFTMKAALLGKNIQGRFREILPVILSAKTIYFSNDPAVYLKIKHIRAGGLERKLSALYDFQLSFVCDPFYYIRNVEPVIMTTPGSITNPGGVFSLPVIKVYGTGSQTLTVGGKETKLNILAGHLIVDSALMECSQGGTAQNNQMQGPFPVFNTGTTAITWSSGITKIEIEPRWRFL
jgi:phage-related protein